MPRRAALAAIGLAGLVALAAGSCGFKRSACNDFCDFHVDCVVPEDCDDKDIQEKCVDSCKEADGKLSDSEVELFQKCADCIRELDKNDRCNQIDGCESCTELSASAETFFEVFTEKLDEKTSCGGGYYGPR